MNIRYCACAGSKNREDAFVSVFPSDDGITVTVQSKVKALFGDQIEAAARELLEKYGVENCRMTIDDFSALDYTVRARIETAILRGTGGGR